jgi:hypothetical protein
MVHGPLMPRASLLPQGAASAANRPRCCMVLRLPADLEEHERRPQPRKVRHRAHEGSTIHTNSDQLELGLAASSPQRSNPACLHRIEQFSRSPDGWLCKVEFGEGLWRD